LPFWMNVQRCLMEIPEADYDRRLKEYQADLGRPSDEIVQKHILTGLPAALTPDDYFNLRNDVSKHFGIQPVEVVLVGSCRVGFSLLDKPKKSRPRYSPVGAASDIDLAVVAPGLFKQLWDQVFAYSQSNRAFAKSPEGTQFRLMLFGGWIDPRGLPPGQRFQWADTWVRFFDGLSRDRRFGNRRASARVYRDWNRLAAYQQIAVDQCKRVLGRQPE